MRSRRRARSSGPETRSSELRAPAKPFSAAVAVALIDTGAVPEKIPGRPLVFRRGSASIEPFVAVQQLADGTLTLEEWQAQCRAMGIAGRRLRPGAGDGIAGGAQVLA